jgi:aminoglycoside phosphotransferase (APT) family kinase protein
VLPAFGRLSRWLAKAVADATSDYPVTIVHGDYRLDNVVLDAESAHVQAVLDWEMSTLGDPLMDLALLLVYWEQPGDHLRRHIDVARSLTASPGFWSREDVLSGYLAQAGASSEHLKICLALACLKLAVIMEGIHRRYLAGHAVDGLSSNLATAAPALLEMGLLVASGGGVAALSE